MRPSWSLVSYWANYDSTYWWTLSYRKPLVVLPMHACSLLRASRVTHLVSHHLKFFTKLKPLQNVQSGFDYYLSVELTQDKASVHLVLAKVGQTLIWQSCVLCCIGTATATGCRYMPALCSSETLNAVVRADVASCLLVIPPYVASCIMLKEERKRVEPVNSLRQ